ncbi:MAG: type IV pilus assembly protein PilM [Planctomycetes bacterium]|nr:type IV pilus assembly protein PilM [Planctomycetota bacterium]
MAAKEAWGLDLGQSAIRLVKLQRIKGDVQIVDYAYVPLKIASGELNYEDPELIELMTRTVKEKGIGNTPVFASIPGQSSFFRDFPLPAISPGKLNEIVSYEARQQIPYPLEEVLWGYHHHEPEEDGADLSISLVCCRHDIVNGLLNFLKSVGLNVTGIQVGPVALANFLMYDQPPEGIALVLDSGARATDLLVFGKYHFWLRSIAGAGDELTSALMEKFNLPYGEAEDLKRKMGESQQADRVFQVVSPVLRGVTSEIQRSLGWYKSQHRGVRISSLICAGGTFLLPGVKELISENIRMPATLVGQLQTVGFGEGADAAAFNNHRQVFGTAVGLALQGVGEATMNINLLPPEVKLRQMIKAKFIYAVAIVALLAIMTMVSYLSASKQAGKWDNIVKSSQRIVSDSGSAARQKNKLSEVQRKAEPIKAKLKTFAQIAINRQDIQAGISLILDVFHQINQQRADMIKNAKYGNQDNVDTLARTLYNRTEVQNQLNAKKADYFDPEELEREIRKQCKLRAQQLIDRRRRIFITEINSESKYESWYINKEIDNQGNEVERLISQAEKIELQNAAMRSSKPDSLGGRGGSGGMPPEAMMYAPPVYSDPNSFTPNMGAVETDEDSSEKYPPFHVVWLHISGFSVSNKSELAEDVISLGKDLENVKGVLSSKVTPAQNFAENDVPVLDYNYGGNIESTEELWVIEKENIIKFELEIAYLPERYWQDLPSGAKSQIGLEVTEPEKDNIFNPDE